MDLINPHVELWGGGRGELEVFWKEVVAAKKSNQEFKNGPNPDGWIAKMAARMDARLGI